MNFEQDGPQPCVRIRFSMNTQMTVDGLRRKAFYRVGEGSRFTVQEKLYYQHRSLEWVKNQILVMRVSARNRNDIVDFDYGGEEDL